MRVISELSGKMQVRQARTAVPAIRVLLTVLRATVPVLIVLRAVRFLQVTAHRRTVRVVTAQAVVRFHRVAAAVVQIHHPIARHPIAPVAVHWGQLAI